MLFSDVTSDWSSDVTVVLDETQPSGADVDYFNLQMALGGHAIPPDLRKDFKEKDKSPCRVQSIPGIKNVIFISRAQQAALFRDGTEGWKLFHKKYGKRASMMTFSRVGFSADGKLALVHVSSGIDSTAGGGELYLLELRSGKWVTKCSIQTWTT